MRGGGVDARADQFAFCVALWEALYGERPFAGASARRARLRDREASGCAGRAPRVVPASVSARLRAGSRAMRTARFPSMEALLAALAPRRRFARPALAALTLAFLSSTVAVEVAHSTAREIDRAAMCRAPEIASPPVERARRAAVTAALGGADAAAKDCARHVVATLDDYAGWVLGHTRRATPPTCWANSRRRCSICACSVSSSDARKSTSCSSVITSDTKLGDRAAQALQSLTRLDVCGDTATLQRRRPTRRRPSGASTTRTAAAARSPPSSSACTSAPTRSPTPPPPPRLRRAADASALAADASLKMARAQRCLGGGRQPRHARRRVVLAALAHDDLLLTTSPPRPCRATRRGRVRRCGPLGGHRRRSGQARGDDLRAEAERHYALAVLQWRLRSYDAAIEQHPQAQRALERVAATTSSGCAISASSPACSATWGVSPRRRRERDGARRPGAPRRPRQLRDPHRRREHRARPLGAGRPAGTLAGDERLFEHPDAPNRSHYSTAEANFGWMLLEAGRTAEAETRLRTRSPQPRASTAATTRSWSSRSAAWRLLVAEGRAAAAIAPLERALGLQRGEAMAGDRADLVRAGAGPVVDQSRLRPRAHACRRRGALLDRPSARRAPPPPLADAQAWLRAHGPPR